MAPAGSSMLRPSMAAATSSCVPPPRPPRPARPPPRPLFTPSAPLPPRPPPGFFPPASVFFSFLARGTGGDSRGGDDSTPLPCPLPTSSHPSSPSSALAFDLSYASSSARRLAFAAAVASAASAAAARALAASIASRSTRSASASPSTLAFLRALAGWTGSYRLRPSGHRTSSSVRHGGLFVSGDLSRASAR